MWSQLKEYLVNFWIEAPITFSSKQALVLVILLVLLGGFLIYKNSKKPAVIKDITSKSETQTHNGFIIDISGEVKKPGIYEVDEGSRIYDVVKKAGGLTNQADRDSINLAQKIEDEQKIVIPNMNKVSKENSLININQVSPRELEDLPGVGEAIAQRIIEKREADGPFKKIEELNDVEGIGPKKFAKIEKLVSVF